MKQKEELLVKEKTSSTGWMIKLSFFIIGVYIFFCAGPAYYDYTSYRDSHRLTYLEAAGNYVSELTGWESVGEWAKSTSMGWFSLEKEGREFMSKGWDWFNSIWMLFVSIIVLQLLFRLWKIISKVLTLKVGGFWRKLILSFAPTFLWRVLGVAILTSIFYVIFFPTIYGFGSILYEATAHPVLSALFPGF